MKGIDISKYQKDISNFNGVDFVIVKATEGVGYVDKSCDTLYQKAKAQGKKLGVYHFARPDLNSAEAEANFFVENVKGYVKEAILVLDWEPGGSVVVGDNAIPNISRVDWAKAWLDKVYSLTGVKPIIYMSQSPENSYDWSQVANADYGLWVAKYGANNGQQGTQPTIKYWKFYALWQYTSKGRVSGYNGDLDLDVFSGDTSAWDKYAGGSGTPTPQPAPQPAPAPAPTPSGTTYTVKKGDTLSGIATKFGTTYQKIAADNGIADPNKIYPGQVLKINGGSSSSSAEYYTVQKGDTLSKIASKYGTTYQHLAQVNGISNPNKIYVGQKIVIK